MHADPRTNLHNPTGPARTLAASTAMLQEWIAHWSAHGFGYQVVEAADSPGSVLGVTGVRHSTWLDVHVLNLYYRYGAEHHGHGYATEGARHVLAWARTRNPDLPVLANTTTDNVASQRTAVAAGLHRRPDLEAMWHGRWSVILVSHWPTP